MRIRHSAAYSTSYADTNPAAFPSAGSIYSNICSYLLGHLINLKNVQNTNFAMVKYFKARQ